MVKIPTSQDYDGFVNDFTRQLEHGGYQNKVCFFLYGSYPEGRADIGRSDIDGGLIINSHPVIDLKEVLDISRRLASSLSKYRVDLQFNLTDTVSNFDGRFMSYSKAYTDWIKSKGKVLFGPDLREGMNGLDFKSDALYSASHNLRNSRNGLLHAMDNLSNDSQQFRKDTKSALERFAKLPKKLIELRGGEVNPNRLASQMKIAPLLPGYDTDVLSKVNALLKDIPSFNRLLDDPQKSLSAYVAALNSAHKMIFEYIKTFPNLSRSEARP